MKKLTFDLEKALAGHPLVTREGFSVRNFIKDSLDTSAYNCSAEVYTGDYWGVLSFTEKGEYFNSSEKHPLDLFLLDTQSTPNETPTRTPKGILEILQPDGYSVEKGRLDMFRSLENSIEKAGGQPDIAKDFLNKPLHELIDALGQNGVRFTFIKNTDH